jgi:predicted CoA-binding protein
LLVLEFIMNHQEEYSAEYIASILKDTKSIAMVGASPDPTKFSYGVLRVLHEQGFKMYPVNPKEGVTEIRGIPVYPSLAAIPGPVDMVEVFRRSDALYSVTEEAIAIGANILWAQIGVVDEKAAKLAEDAGMRVIMDRCVKIELFRPFWKPRLNQQI